MRAVRMLVGLGIVLVFAVAARAEQVSDTVPLYQAKVAIDDALVRSGPSVTFYPTNKLHKGELVEVVGEERDGWLRVLPPLDGSFSYVQLKHVEQFTQKVWVVKERTKPLIGSGVVGSKPNVEGPALAPGTQLESLGMSKQDQGETWLRIVPPRREVRYISARDVQRMDDAEPAIPAKSLGDKVPVIPVSQQKTGDPTTRFSPASYQTVGTTDRGPAVTSSPFVSSGQPGYCVPQPSAQLCVPTPVQLVGQQGAYVTGTIPVQWSGVGKLLSSGYTIDGKRAYRLVDKYDRLMMYVTSGPKAELEPYVFRNVDLQGPLSYRGDYRANYMMVEMIVPAP